MSKKQTYGLHDEMPLYAHEDTGNEVPITNGYSNSNSHATMLEVCGRIAEGVNKFLNTEQSTPLLKSTQSRTKLALEVIQEALQRYSIEEISLSYNGGKDCLVLLILLLCALYKSETPLPTALQTVYIISPHPFAEVDEFVDISVSTYKLDLSRYAMPMKEAFEKYLEERKAVKAILVGTRRTDPHGEKLTHFDRTDHGWPAFMRVHPVIDWHYAEIWTFIRYLEIPYCVLYDQGYTSLGGTTDTHPNPALKSGEGTKQNSDSRKGHFRPAYELVEDDAERLGRDW